MKYKLIERDDCQNIPGLPTRIEILLNRGMRRDLINKYINADEQSINSPSALGEEKIEEAYNLLMKHINNDSRSIIIIDCDVDGNTSSALFLNYFYNIYPNWIKNKVDFFFHKGKEHGLNDCYQDIISKKYQFVICPDAGSNDTNECEILKENNIDVLILDHHDFDKENPYAIVINNQEGYSNYPNKALSGVGVVWQFCRYCDLKMQTNYADKYIDLVAIGNCGDMMDMRSIETAYLIHKGLKAISNPCIYYLAQKNAFKLGSHITPIGAAFYIVPLLNAIQRSGTMEEKELVFFSLLNYKAFEVIPSNKRGHKPGDTETIVEQAIRTCTNVKNRQTRIQDNSLELLEKKIQEQNLLNNKVLIILLDERDNIPSEVRGLIANKFMAKYQRPCCILTKGEEYCGQTLDGYRYETFYAGSARGCSLAGVDDFKSICLNTEDVEYAVGHSNAFGLKIYEKQLQDFIDKTNDILKDMSDEPIYYVDYEFHGKDVNGKIIIDIADMQDYWGTELDEALVAIKELKITNDMVDIYRKKNNTIKISLPNGVSIMKFDADEELCNKLTVNNTGYIEMDIVGKCNANEWCGNITPQIFIEDFNIIDSNKYYF